MKKYKVGDYYNFEKNEKTIVSKKRDNRLCRTILL